MTDREACYDRVVVEAFEAAIGVLADHVTPPVVHDLLARAARADSLYSSVVFSMAAVVMSEYCMPVIDQTTVKLTAVGYMKAFDAERGFDMTDV